ncbi:DinB family protein [Amycolatopsis viridis]|uniref:Damage-inducible protein DinB n=1 Tax=Amycolatopsis viridis TaxID=185678 RepID=A0ABX0SVK8_9PSEU|nr:DinB family protein [Amycolatopsis viridis]NIH81001.1 putative damage-inducible protein DinB [Amycolatopsis viridis]
MPTERPEVPTVAGEREMLRAHLEFHRATLARKCDGLSDEELRRQAVPPSALSLLGLVRHMAEVERAWFRRTVGGETDLPLVWSADGDFQVAYDARTSSRAEAFTAWQDEIGHARRIERAADSLDVTVFAPRWNAEVSLRAVMLHMIHEYARHNGHADLLREGIDGVTGV